MSRIRIVVALVAMLALGALVPALASSRPAGGCPPPFGLQATSEFGPGFQDFLAQVDKNDDDLVCTQPLPDALPFPNINFIDNVIRR